MTSSIHHALGVSLVLFITHLVTTAKATLHPASLPFRSILAKNQFLLRLYTSPSLPAESRNKLPHQIASPSPISLPP